MIEIFKSQRTGNSNLTKTLNVNVTDREVFNQWKLTYSMYPYSYELAKISRQGFFYIEFNHILVAHI